MGMQQFIWEEEQPAAREVRIDKIKIYAHR